LHLVYCKEYVVPVSSLVSGVGLFARYTALTDSAEDEVQD